MSNKAIPKERFDFLVFYGMACSDSFWFRLRPFGIGLTFTKRKMVFSERNGMKKFINLPYGWRARVLKRGTV